MQNKLTGLLLLLRIATGASCRHNTHLQSYMVPLEKGFYPVNLE